MSQRTRSLISLHDLDQEDLLSLVRGAADLSKEQPEGALDGRVVATFFTKTSTRTRTSFQVAALRLGARLIELRSDDLQLTTGESQDDTMRVLAGMVDAVVMRTAGPEAEMRAAAQGNPWSVVNAMSAEEHPTQAISDTGWLLRHFGDLEGLTISYVGEGNNTATALAACLTRFPGVRLEMCCPPGYGLPADVVERARLLAQDSGATLCLVDDPSELSAGTDVLYTTRWQTTGSSKADVNWRETFEPFRIDGQLLERCAKAVVMHDLPAHRGEEITAEVLDGPRSVAFDQAHAKVFGAMSTLLWCLT